MVMRSRRGRSTLGCLTMLLLLVAAFYFAANIGQAYFDYYFLRDSMQQQARFGSRMTDQQIRRALVAKVDSLGLPEQAGRFVIQRGGGRITISTAYTQFIELPLVSREFTFNPSVEAPF